MSHRTLFCRAIEDAGLLRSDMALFLTVIVLGVAVFASLAPSIAFIQPRSAILSVPAVVEVQVLVPRHADNRIVVIEWDAVRCSSIASCEDHGLCEAGRFDIQIDGAQASTIQPLEARHINIWTPCPYQFDATLFGVGNEIRGYASQRVLIK